MTQPNDFRVPPRRDTPEPAPAFGLSFDDLYRREGLEKIDAKRAA